MKGLELDQHLVASILCPAVVLLHDFPTSWEEFHRSVFSELEL
jgi:hypothetical protein